MTLDTDAVASLTSELQALVLCAGEGSRLRPLTLTRPKPLIEVGGSPLVAHALRWLRSFGIRDVAINLHYLPETITTVLGDGSQYGVAITYSYEETLLGTAGAARQLLDWFRGTFIVVYGDVLTDVDITTLLQTHRTNHAIATLGLVASDDLTSKGVVVTDESGRIIEFVEKPSPDRLARLQATPVTLWANGGIYIVEPEALAAITPNTPYDFGHDLFPSLLAKQSALYGCPLQGYLQDIGSHEWLAQARADLAAGKVRVPKNIAHVTGAVR